MMNKTPYLTICKLYNLVYQINSTKIKFIFSMFSQVEKTGSFILSILRAVNELLPTRIAYFVRPIVENVGNIGRCFQR